MDGRAWKRGEFHRFNQVLLLAPHKQGKTFTVFLGKQWIRCVTFWHWCVSKLSVSNWTLRWSFVWAFHWCYDASSVFSVEVGQDSGQADGHCDAGDCWSAVARLHNWRDADFWDCGGSFDYLTSSFLPRQQLSVFVVVFKALIQRKHCVMASCVKIELQAIFCFKKSCKKKKTTKKQMHLCNIEITWLPWRGILLLRDLCTAGHHNKYTYA